MVNSSRGGGSKDTWVLEDGDDADRAGPPIADTQPPALPTCATAPGPDSSSNSSRTRWPTRMVISDAREDRPRALLAGPEPGPRRVHRPRRGGGLSLRASGHLRGHPGVSFGSGGLLAILGDTGESNGGGQALDQLTLDPQRPGSMMASMERAREGRAPYAT